jgi:high-affinity Fe2+/Pb2+ permease
VVFVAGLFTFNRSYLQPYGSASGLVVLTAVIGLFVAALSSMNRLAKFEAPPRFVSNRGVTA